MAKKKSKSFYSKSVLVDIRTINYRFSVKTKADQAYLDLKGVIADHNKGQEQMEELGITPHYLRVRGRGRGSHKLGAITYKHSIPDHMADYFDVYVVKNTDRQRAAELRMSVAKAAKKSTTKLASIVTQRTINTNGLAAVA